MAAPVYQPVGDPVGPPRQGGFRSELASAARNLGPVLGILSAAAAFTFLVPTLLTLAKFAQPQTTTTPPLPKMPMVDVPATAASTESVTTSTSTTARPRLSTTESEGKGSQKLDVELDFNLKSQDAASLDVEDLVTRVQRSIAQKAQVKRKYVDVTTRATQEGRHVHAVVRPPKGRTPGDLRAMLVTLKPLLAQALQGGAALEVQPVQVSFIEAAKVTPLPTAAPEPEAAPSTTLPAPKPLPEAPPASLAPVHHRWNSTGRVAMMFVLELQMKIEDLAAFDVQKYTDAFAQEVREDRSLVMVVKTEFRTEVRYLVPHLLSKMQLRKAMAEALHVPLFAVSVEPAESARRLRAMEGTRELLCVVTTEDPASAETFAEMMKDPGEVVQAMRLQGLSLPLELKRKPWASVLVHTKLELRGKAPEVSNHFSALLSHQLGVPVSADTIGVRQVLHQELLGTGSDAPPGPAVLPKAAAPAAPAVPAVLPAPAAPAVAGPRDAEGLPAPLPLRANKVNYNNLLTSSHRFPPVLRYGHVGYVEHAGGKVWLDVVLRVDGYKPKLHALTGEAQGSAAALNVHAGTKADLQISLVPSERNIEVESLKIRQIYLQISDIEDPARLLDDEVTLKSCQEVLWPNGEKFHPSEDYTLPAGLAPQVLFNGAEAHVTLRAARRAGNALGAFWQGRTFFISLRSPDVVPVEDTAQGSESTESLDLGYKLELTRHKILYNNLGGFGPGHLDEPMLMRFEKTCAIDDQRVDLVLSAPHGYHPQRPALNGVHNGNAAVSVAAGTSVDLTLLLTTQSGDQAAPMMLSRLYVSIFDQDGPDGLSGLGKVAVRGFEAVIFANGTRVPSWTLPNTGQHGAWVVPVGPKVLFLFRYVTKLVITLAAPQGGHSFYISLQTPDAEAYSESTNARAAPAAPAAGAKETEVSDSGQHGFPSHLGRAFELRQSKVQYNNLANHGPTKGPPVLRYHNACSKEGQNVDVVFHLVGRDYQPSMARLNGLNGFYWAAPISVSLGSELHLHLSLVSKEDTPVPFQKLYLTVFDVEEPSVGITEESVQVHDFEAVLWPDGTKTSAELVPKEWMPPRGPAPTYQFTARQEISVVLHGVQRPGNAVSARWQGRTFFLALHSPEAQKPIEAPVQVSHLPHVPAAPAPEEAQKAVDMGVPLALTEHNVVYNNLAGQGPGHLDDPLELRFADTAETLPTNHRGSAGQRVDVVFLVHGDYQPANSALNGAENGRATVSVKSGTSLRLELRLLGAAATEDPGETRSPIDLDLFVCVKADAGDVSAERGLQAVVFANGTSITMHQVQLPALDAPCLRFAGSSAQLSLRAKDRDAIFRLGMFSPEVQAFHEVAPPDHTDLRQPASGQAFSESEPKDVTAREAAARFGKKMVLSKTNVICNNLGGFGPEKNAPAAQLHYRAVAHLQGHAVDVVLEAGEGYHPKKALLNGLASHHYAASVNVATNTEAKIEVRFLMASHQVQESQPLPVKFSKLFVSVFDSEEPMKSLRGGEVLLHDVKAAFWPNGTLWTKIDEAAYVVPGGVAPVMLFEDVTSVSMTLTPKDSPGNSLGGFWAGRTFFITLRSPDLAGDTTDKVHLETAGAHHADKSGTAVSPVTDLGVSLTSSGNVVYNNLGMKGPGHLDEPPVIRLDSTVRDPDGRHLDLVLSLLHGKNFYEPSGINEVDASGILVNVAFGSAADLEIQLCTSQESSVALEHLYLQVSDLQENGEASLATDGEAIFRGFEAIRYPGKSWIRASDLASSGSDEDQEWVAPSGPAPVVLFRKQGKIKVTLRAKPQGPFTGPGRRFLLQLHSPDVKEHRQAAKPTGTVPQPHHLHHAAALGKAPMLPSQMGTLLKMGHENMHFNNLGGRGPGHLDEPAILRFDNCASVVAKSGERSQVDVVIRALSGYTPQKVELNGHMGGTRASINVAIETSVSLKISLMKPEESQQLEPLEVSDLLLTVYDVEEPERSLAADGEVEIGGFQALIWPNGTALSALTVRQQGVFSVPQGPAPSFFFHQTTEVTLKLSAKQAGGNALGSLLAGRSFFITLQSPDLEAPDPLPRPDSTSPLAAPSPRMVALARRTQSTPSPGMSESGLDLEAFFPSSFGTKMMLSPHNVMYNNLAGRGPIRSDPPVMRYHAACFKQGRPIDVVFHAQRYRPGAVALNALLGHHYSASINVAMNSTLELLVELRSEDRPLSLRRLYLSVSDTEDEESSISSPDTVVAEDFEAVKLPSSNTWSTPSVLGEDWSAPVGGASPVIFTFWNVQKVHLTLRALPKPGAVVDFNEGRSFFISMWSPDVDVPQAKALPVLAAAPPPAGPTHATTLRTTTTLLSTTSTEALDLPESLGPWLMLRRSNVVFNNLGGQGPGHLDEPNELRFAHVAVAAEGPVDLVLHATSSYHPGLVALNGGAAVSSNASAKGPPHAVVNVALGRSLSLDVKLVKHQQVLPVSSWFLLMVYDVEDPFPTLSSSSEVFVSGVEAMFPQSKDGQWQRVPPKANYEAFTVPPGPAPMLAVKGSVRLTLRPASTGSSASGRSFYIALRTPELQAYSTTHPLARLAHLILPGTTTTPTTPTTTTVPAMPPLRLGRQGHAAPQAQWVRQPLIQGFLGPYLALTPSQVVVNNLAGAGPDHTGGPKWPSTAEPELRWRAGRLKGENLEVVLKAVSSYVPQTVALNGREAAVPAATVNVAMGTSVKLRFDFRTSDKQGTEISEISLPRLYLQIFDEEEPRFAMSTKGQAKVLDYEGVSWPNGTWQPGGFGQAFTLPRGPAPTVAFTSCSSVTVTLHALPNRGSVLGSPWEGRTFSISLRSPDVAVPNSTGFAPGTSAAAALRHHWPPVLGATFAGTMGTMQAANASQVVLRGPAAAAAAESFGSEYGLRPKSVAPPAWATGTSTTVSTANEPSSTSPSTSQAGSELAAAMAAMAAMAPAVVPSATSTRSSIFTSVTSTFVPTGTVTFTAPSTWTFTSTTVTSTTVSTSTVTFPATRTLTWSSVTSTTMSTSVNPVVVAPWQRAATAPEYAKEVGVTMEVEHVDYKRIAFARPMARQDLVEGLRQTLAWRAGLRQGHPIQVQDLDLSPGFQGSLLLRSTLSSKRPLDVAKLQWSFQSRIFQQDLFEAINASEAASAVRGPVQVRAVSVAPIMHSGTVAPSKTLWKMMGLSGWRLSEVLLFLLFVLTLCCLIPLLARFLTQSWSRSADSMASVAGFGGASGDARFVRGPLDGDAWSNASTFSDRNLVDPWSGGFSNYEVDRRRGGDLGFSALGPPPRPRSYDEEGSLAEAMLSPTPSYPSRGRSGSSAPSPSRSLRQVPPPLLSDISLGSASSRPGAGPPPVRLSSGEGIPAVVRARPLARSWLEDQGRQVDVVPARYLDPIDPGFSERNAIRNAEVYSRDRVRQMEIDPRSGRPWSGH